MRILFIGDIVAKPGRTIIKNLLPEMRSSENIDVVVANAENAAHGRGVTTEIIEDLQKAGVDFFTGGDHIFWRNEIFDDLDTLPLIRPANYPEGTPGKGWHILDLGSKGKLLIVNLMGRTSFGGNFSLLNDPFRLADEILNETSGQDITFSLIDFHAEATSEKHAFAYYLDGRVGAVAGTHTHVPTCDERILPLGTAYVTDVGMTGVIDSVLGVTKEIIINQFLTAQNQRFEWESTGKSALRSVIIDTERKTIVRLDKTD